MITADRILELGKQARTEKPIENSLFPPSEYYRFFRLLAQELKPELSVVLGVCGGGDCYYMSKGYSNGLVIGIDVVYDHAIQILTIQKDCPNFRFVRGDSVKVLSDDLFKRTYLSDQKVDILFIDTTHTYDQTVDEFYSWKPYLKPGAVVCLDDLFREGMGTVWNDLPGTKIRMDELHIGGGPLDGGFGVILT